MTLSDWAILAGAWLLLAILVAMGVGAAAKENERWHREVDPRRITLRDLSRIRAWRRNR